MYLKFNCFERLSLSVWLFSKAIIGSFLWIYVNARGKYILKVLINTHFNNSLKEKNYWIFEHIDLCITDSNYFHRTISKQPSLGTHLFLVKKEGKINLRNLELATWQPLERGWWPYFYRRGANLSGILTGFQHTLKQLPVKYIPVKLVNNWKL